MTLAETPVVDVDLYADDALAEPYEHYRAIRDAGPVVWLPQCAAYGIFRHQDVRAVLADAATFCSGRGVGLNDIINEAGQGTTLMTDGDEHRAMRNVIGPPLTPRAISGLQPTAQALAEQLVDGLLERRRFDAVTDLAEVLPSQWVPDLLGWPDDGRDHLLDWAAAVFDGLGPPNARMAAAGAGLIEMALFAGEVMQRALPPESMAARVIAAARRGEISWEQCPMAIVDYLGPSLDTTISAIGNAIWLFATHPDQWQLLRDDPSRVRHAFNEVLRVESPVTGFTRVTTAPTNIDGADVPGDARLLVSFASANRDERRWDQPEVFDITRENADHVAFGYGEHACVGMGLARLEGAAILAALAERVDRIELTAEPQRKFNNTIRAFAALPVEIHPA